MPSPDLFPPRAAALVLLAAIALAPACGKPASSNAAAPGDRVRCSTHVVPDAPVDGQLSKPGLSGLLIFTIDTFSPYPAQTGANSWTLTLTDAAGTPVTGATFAPVVPAMPDHGHSSPTTPRVVAEGDRYTLATLNFFMPGLWQVSLTATTPAGVTDTAIVDLCVGTD